MTGDNTPCKMCPVAQRPNCLLVGRWCLPTVRRPSPVCRLPLRTAPQAKHGPPCSVFFVLVLGLCSFFLFWFFSSLTSRDGAGIRPVHVGARSGCKGDVQSLVVTNTTSHSRGQHRAWWSTGSRGPLPPGPEPLPPAAMASSWGAPTSDVGAATSGAGALAPKSVVTTQTS